jgi:fatty-acyl-CoA synthase
MSGYLNNPDATREALTDGWLDTGDLGYMYGGDLFVTGRRLDVIIVNGRNIRAQDLEELAELQPEIRSGNASAFAVLDAKGFPSVVIVIESRLSDSAARQSLSIRLQRLAYEAFGIQCIVEVVLPRTLPRTSSGKLSRAAARQGFLQRSGWDQERVAEADSV